MLCKDLTHSRVSFISCALILGEGQIWAYHLFRSFQSMSTATWHAHQQ